MQKNVQNQIDKLINVSSLVHNSLEESFEISVKPKLMCTMVDGKAINAITGTTSQQVCSICKASPKEMNVRAKLIKKYLIKIHSNTEFLLYFFC